jgi:hypothetical protein
MAFKQPYNNFNKQGASIAPLAAAAPAAVKGFAALLAKLGIGKGLAATGTKVATKALTKKAGSKLLQSGGKTIVKKGGEKATGEIVKKGAVNVVKDATPTLKTNITSSVAKSNKGSLKSGIKKISEGYNKKISNLAKDLGTDADKVDQFVKTSAANLGNTVASKINSNEEEVNPYSSKKTTIINTPKNENYGYSTPQGPSQGYSNPAGISKSDEAVNAITPKKNDFISNFHAPVNVQGITFDAGDAVRAARLLANAIKDRKPRSSRFKKISDKDIKSSVAKHEYEQDLKYKPGGDAMGDTNFSYSKKGLGGKIQEYKIRKNKISKSTSAKSSSVKPTTVKPTPVKPTSTESTSKFYNAKSKRKNRLENKKRFKTNTKNLIAGK